MKKDKARQISRPGDIFNKWIIGGLGVLFIISTILACRALRQPSRIQERVVENIISQYTYFNYKAEVVPCTLFPKGGVVEPEEAMYTAITKAIHLNITSIIKSGQPVSVQGVRRVFVRLIAEGLWERQFVLEAREEFSLEGNENKLVEKDYIINIDDITEYIGKVEEEIVIRPDKYLLNIKPEIEGNVIYDGNKFPIDSTPEISFEFSDQIKRIGEKEFTKETPVETLISINQSFKMLNVSIPLVTARILFPAISLIILGIIIFGGYRIRGTDKKDVFEASKIEKKYNNKLTFIDRNISVLNKITVNVKSFKSLIQLADDKEQPLLRYKSSDIGRVFYYVIDGDCVYSYSANDKGENLSLMEVSASASENNINQGR